MRIIDKNSDFYDYFQNIYYDNSLTFDRRSSFILTKEMISFHLFNRTQQYLLLQVCHTFWLFSITPTKTNQYGNVKDYTLTLLTNWRNYNKKRKLIQLCIISFSSIHRKKDVDFLVQQINNNIYSVDSDITHYSFYRENKGRFQKIVKEIPILKACGVAKQIDPLTLYLSFEEYFTLKKSDSERRDPKGITDIDRIESHGFDKQKSFRKESKNG